MLCIKSQTTNPYLNIAAEEHLLKSYSDDIFFLYRNEPSVIVGKHQNTVAEIDADFAERNGITVVRRLSGGGAVYHDLGNLNFCFVKNGSEGNLVDFKAFTRPVIEALQQIGVHAKHEGHNSLLVNGRKISGNAEHVFKNRVLHHGTLLFSTNLEQLARVLYVDLDRFSDKAVKSVRANVVNLIDLIEPKLDELTFSNHIFDSIKAMNAHSREHSFSENDLEAIHRLAKEKFSTWEWTFGYSPAYSFTRKVDVGDEVFWATFWVEKGVIVRLDFAERTSRSEDIIGFFVGQQHSKPKLFERYRSGNYSGNTMVKRILESL